MPTRTGQDSKGCYARWGRHGKKYYYACGDTSARKYAVSKADRQGRAVRASGWTGNAVLTAKRRRGKLDPSRTYALRKRFVAEMRRRMNALVREVYAQVVTRDAYGLIEKEKQAARLALHAGYAFATDAQKVTAFRQWLQQQVDDKVLSVQGGKAGEPWTSQYVQSAYKQGAYRSYASKYKTEAERRAPGLGVTRGEFIKEAFFSPEMMSKVELLSTRAYESLKGITTAMASEMNRVFATALVEGRGAAKTARMLRDTVGNLTNRRALVLARTEVIYAHAEGQLDGYAQLGVDTVKAEVEWSTANDGAVCEECGSMEGQVYRVSEAHGMIPLHPNCRCAWVPVEEGAKKSVVEAISPYKGVIKDMDAYVAERVAAGEISQAESTAVLREMMGAIDSGKLAKYLLSDSSKMRDARALMTAVDVDALGLKSTGAKELLTALREGSVSEHSFVKLAGRYVDPYLKSLGVKQSEIDKVGKYLYDVYTRAGMESVYAKKVTGVVAPAIKAVVKPAVTRVAPTAPVTGSTRYATAAEYRTALIDSVDKQALVHADDVTKLSKQVDDLSKKSWHKYTKYADAKRRGEADDVVNALFKEYAAESGAVTKMQIELKALKKAAQLDVAAQRALLAEDQNLSALFLSAKGDAAGYSKTAKELLSWVPKNSVTDVERESLARVSVRSVKTLNGASGEYNYTRSSITLHARQATQQVFAHEYGHHLSYQLGRFMNAQNRFFARRTAGESVVKLGYGIKGKRDRFDTYRVYAGRVYSDGRYPEVASVGVETIWADPYAAAKADPEWFDMVIGALKGIE